MLSLQLCTVQFLTIQYRKFFRANQSVWQNLDDVLRNFKCKFSSCTQSFQKQKSSHLLDINRHLLKLTNTDFLEVLYFTLDIQIFVPHGTILLTYRFLFLQILFLFFQVPINFTQSLHNFTRHYSQYFIIYFIFRGFFLFF